MTSRREFLNASAASAEQAIPQRTWAAPPRSLRNVLSLDDLEEPARRYIPRPIFGYVVSGAEREASIRANRAAYDDLAFVPRILVNTAASTQKRTLFGRRGSLHRPW